MSVWITNLGYALPEFALEQQAFAEWFLPRLAPGSRTDRLQRFAQRSGVNKRYSVLNFLGEDGERFFPIGQAHADAGARNAIFADRALPLAIAAVRNACPGNLPAITHVIVTTCTGAVAPGLDLQLINGLGLSPQVQRTMVGFMGCYAAIPALRLARDACRADPSAIVLVVCCELSSLHLQAGPEDDALLGACLFGDGASAAIVQASDEARGLGLEVMASKCVVVPNTADQMAWVGGASGFNLRLSPGVSKSLALDMAPLVDSLLSGITRDSVKWTVHPGGPRILDDVERHLALKSGALDDSRTALSEAGNRSSGTILAILSDQVRQSWTGPCTLLAFGPGLTAESMLLKRH
jgi:alpha-pyrone synthase